MRTMAVATNAGKFSTGSNVVAGVSAAPSPVVVATQKEQYSCCGCESEDNGLLLQEGDVEKGRPFHPSDNGWFLLLLLAVAAVVILFVYACEKASCGSNIVFIGVLGVVSARVVGYQGLLCPREERQRWERKKLETNPKK